MVVGGPLSGFQADQSPPATSPDDPPTRTIRRPGRSADPVAAGSADATWRLVDDQDLPRRDYHEGGKREVLAFTGRGARSGSPSAARQARTGWCGSTESSSTTGDAPPQCRPRCSRVPLDSRKGKNEVVVAMIPVESAGADQTAAEWADEAVAFACPYPAEMRLWPSRARTRPR
jgi:hypothetical protein